MAKQGYFSGKTEYDKNARTRSDGGAQGKRTSGSDTGGYSKHSGKPAYGNRNGKPAYGDRDGRPAYGDRNDKPAYGDRNGRPAYGDRNGKPAYGDRGGKPAYGDRNDKPAYGDRDSRPAYGDRNGGPAYGDRNGKPAYGDRNGKPAYGDRNGKPAYGDRNGKPAYGDRNGKPAYGDRNGKPAYGDHGGKPAYGEQQRYDKRKPYERDHARESADTAREAEAVETAQQGGEDELPFLIIGRNAVREAIRSGRSIDRILVSAEPDGSLREIVGQARDAKIPLRETNKKALDELCLPFGHGGKTANHQGIVAYAAGVEYVDVSDILARAKEKDEKPFVIVLDGIMDPHNLGSIIRSAECAGAHGVIIGKRRSASVSAAAVKASAGAVEHVAIARVTNINAALKELKDAGVWIAGADMAGKPMEQCAMDGALAIVIGNEGEGLSKLTSDSCDFLVSIPLFGKLDSLNASVAAGVLMFEKKRQDAGK